MCVICGQIHYCDVSLQYEKLRASKLKIQLFMGGSCTLYLNLNNSE